MTVDTLAPDADTELVDDVPAGPDRLRRTLLAIIAVGVIAILVAGGFLWGSRTAPSPATMPTVNSVDAGFARDMSTHHQQAITMAGYVRDNPSNANVANLAYDIETSQTIQLGEMTGWLDTWNILRTSGTQMSWMPMGHQMAGDGLMPGMATPAEMTKLMSLHGKAMDIMFLQLMIRHHQGGLPMERYAATHAREAYVRDLAGHMVASQSTEIVQMEQTLRQLGGVPLAPPAS